jgi:hypothetical protein
MYGAVSDTTVNLCELSPYLHMMQWYSRGPGKDLRKKINAFMPRLVTVHIVTDCEIIAKQGNKKADRNANAAFWAAMDYFPRIGYNLSYHYFPREQFASNRACDSLSKDMRHLISSIEERVGIVVPPNAYDDSFGQPTPQE